MQRSYEDPLDAIWFRVAERLGWRIERTMEVYASWDGESVMRLSDPADMDPDDCVAQMLLHEVCHALIAGPKKLKARDWGLENIDDRDLVEEHATHRLQAALLGPHGLREMLEPSTEHRPYYKGLPADPLCPGTDPAIPQAQEGWIRATQGAWAPLIQDALVATAALAAVMRPWAGNSMWAETRRPHPTRLHPGERGERCGTCAWNQGGHCLQVDGDVEPDWPDCLRWETPFGSEQCADCGACCHRGFDVVDVEEDEALATSHPHWLTRDRAGLHLERPGGFCPALNQEAPWRCAVYADRPRNCAELVVRGSACLQARRRAGVGP